MDALTKGAQAPVLSDDDNLTREVVQARGQIAHAIQVAGLKNDPLSKVLEAISASMDVQHQLHVANANMRRDLGVRFREDLTEALREARQPVDADSLKRIEVAAGAGVDRHTAALVRSHNRRTMLMAGAALVVTLGVGAVGGASWGWHQAIGNFRMAETGFAAIMHDSPATANGWLDLVRLNSFDTLMKACRGTSGFTTAEGRHACNAPIWLDEEKAPATPERATKP